jgi:hypothetical protein
VTISTFKSTGSSVAKLIVTLGSITIGVVALVLIAVTSVPLSLIPVPLDQGVQFTPLGDARLASGQGIISSRQGTDIVHWHWCPAQGLRALCFQLSGHSGFVEGSLLAGWSHIQINELNFANVSARALAGTALPGDGVLRGEVRNLSLPWRGDCLPQGLRHIRGDMVLADLALGERKIQLVGDGEGSVTISGDFMRGQLALETELIQGLLQVDLPAANGMAGNTAEINVVRRFACGR